MDIARRLSSAIYGDAPKSNTGLETADVNDQETLDRLRDDAKKQARAQIANDLKKFLKKKNHKHSPPPQRRNTYEAWIAQLHPENATVVDGIVTDVDPRFFSEGSDHRAIWNSQNPEKRVDAIVSLDDKYARLDRAATLVQRIYRGAHLRRILRESIFARRRAAQDACLQAWQVACAPLQHRGEAWDRLFCDALPRGRRPSGVVKAAEAEAEAWRHVDATPERRARFRAESKRMYKFLQSLDKRDVGTIASAFGFGPKSRRRKRKVVAALFDSARTAPPSAALLRRAMTPEKPQPARRKTIIGSNGSGSGDKIDALAPPPPGQASASDAAVLRYPRKLGEGRGKKLWESC